MWSPAKMKQIWLKNWRDSETRQIIPPFLTGLFKIHSPWWEWEREFKKINQHQKVKKNVCILWITPSTRNIICKFKIHKSQKMGRCVPLSKVSILKMTSTLSRDRQKPISSFSSMMKVIQDSRLKTHTLATLQNYYLEKS
jgi:hypothetical protein